MPDYLVEGRDRNGDGVQNEMDKMESESESERKVKCVRKEIIDGDKEVS